MFTSSFLSVGREVLSGKFWIGDVAVWTIHFVGISLNSWQTRSKIWFFFLFFFFLRTNLNIPSKSSLYLFIAWYCAAFSDAIGLIDSKFFAFRENFDDIFLEPWSFSLLQGDTIINSKTIDWKIVFRNIWVFKIEIFDRIWFLWILRKKEVSSKSSSLFHLLLIILHKFQ